jgi:hypothetical protein
MASQRTHGPSSSSSSSSSSSQSRSNEPYCLRHGARVARGVYRTFGGELLGGGSSAGRVPPSLSTAQEAAAAAASQRHPSVMETPVFLWANDTGCYLASCELEWADYHAMPPSYAFTKQLSVLSGCGDYNGLDCHLRGARLSERQPPRRMCTQQAGSHHQPVLPTRPLFVSELAELPPPLLPTAPDLFIFHEGRSGSTLVANLFAASARCGVRCVPFGGRFH